MLREAEDVPTEVTESAIARGIVTNAVFVVRAINFDDEADFGRSEVHNPLSDIKLPTEREAGLGACQPAPETLLGAGWRETHVARAVLKELSASEGDERASKHVDLRETPAQARAERRGSAQVSCRARKKEAISREGHSRARGTKRARLEARRAAAPASRPNDGRSLT